MAHYLVRQINIQAHKTVISTLQGPVQMHDTNQTR